MVLRVKNRRDIYCLLCEVGAHKPTRYLLVSFAAQIPDVHNLFRVSGRAYKFLKRKGVSRKITCCETTSPQSNFSEFDRHSYGQQFALVELSRKINLISSFGGNINKGGLNR